jgi:hypothetical protein
LQWFDFRKSLFPKYFFNRSNILKIDSQNFIISWFEIIDLLNCIKKLRKICRKLLIRPKKNMCVYCHMSKKSRVGRSALKKIILLSAKPEIVIPESDSGISFSKFLFWSCFMRVTQFFYLLCSQFRQKASGWINKTFTVTRPTLIFASDHINFYTEFG